MRCASSLLIKQDFEHNNGVSSVKVYGSNQPLLFAAVILMVAYNKQLAVSVNILKKRSPL